jgi:hypothetical protein
MNITEEILAILHTRAPQSQPLTISDFARRLGAPPQVVRNAARELVSRHQAEPVMVDDRGTATLHGLSPVPVPVPVLNK